MKSVDSLKRVIDYQEGTLSDSEKKAFESDMLKDKELQQNLEFYQSLVKTIRSVSTQELTQELERYKMEYKVERTARIRKLVSYTTVGIAASILFFLLFFPRKNAPLTPQVDQPPLMLDSTKYQEILSTDTIKNDTVK